MRIDLDDHDPREIGLAAIFPLSIGLNSDATNQTGRAAPNPKV